VSSTTHIACLLFDRYVNLWSVGSDYRLFLNPLLRHAGKTIGFFFIVDASKALAPVLLRGALDVANIVYGCIALFWRLMAC
jgi:hypothetical protein